MRAIWKFPLQLVDYQEVIVPGGVGPLCVQVQDGAPCLWAEVDPDASSGALAVMIFGTGHALDESEHKRFRYLSTFQMHGGALVFHAYVGEPR